MPAPARTASNDPLNCPARSRIRNRGKAARSPRSISRLRICCAVRRLSGLAVTPGMCTDREPASITDKQYRRWRVTGQSTWEKPVAGIVVAWVCRSCCHVVSVCRFGGWRDRQRPEDPADRGCADPVAGLEQLTVDPLVAPAVVVGGEALGKCGDLGADWRPARPLRRRPFPVGQAMMPPQDGPRVDQPVCPQLPGQDPDQRGHDGSISPVEPGPGLSAAQHGGLVPQHQQFRVHRRC
jgi:hypothetical protein